MTRSGLSGDEFDSASQDEALVGRCRDGSASAWAELIDKYKNLIYSIPVKLGLNRNDCNEIFQEVCSTLLSELQRLREPRALASWLITTTSRSCYRLRREQSRLETFDPGVRDEPSDAAALPDRLLQDLEREQIVREAMHSLEPKCRELVRLLFFSEPAIPYEEAAARLQLAKGSMGATRMRCLAKLKAQLQARGLK